MASRSERAQIGAQTVEIVQRGSYTTPHGKVIDIATAVENAVQGTKLFRPADASMLRRQADDLLRDRNFATTFEVTNETTFSAARRLVNRFGPDKVAALNFASAKNPGGGFLGGSQAQEESLARASALYACLCTKQEYYDSNRAVHSSVYTDHMILSPRVPVIRDDADQLLDQPWEVTIITAPAPNRGAISDNKPAELSQIEPAFRRRIEMILSAAVVENQTALVLGAWGCGVFRNDPNIVARIFGEFLLPGSSFGNAFEHLSFAVLDRQGDTLAAFQKVFAEGR